MPLRISVKWGTQAYDVEINESTSCKEFMKTCSELTGLPVENMKVSGFKSKGFLKPTDDKLLTIGFKTKQKVMIVGHLPSRAVANPSGPVTRFVEDLSKQERLELLNETEKQALPIGINNLGVTCYMNSVVQALRAIPPVKKALIDYAKDNPVKGAGPIDMDSIATDLSHLIVDLEGGTEAPTPTKLIASMRTKFPELTRRSSDNNGFMQQDVDEFWMYLVQIFNESRIGNDKNPITDAFRFENKVTIELDRTVEGQEDLPPLASVVKTDGSSKLTCLMGTVTNPVSQVHQGLKLALDTTLSKRVEELDGKEYQFKSTSKLISLPEFLEIQFVRFEWKKISATRNSDGPSGLRAKVVRRIAFSQSMDLFEYCDETLQRDLGPARNAISDMEINTSKDVEMKDATNENEVDEWVTVPDGSYDLVSVVTHEGRSAESGHYVCWRKKFLDDAPRQKGEDSLWLKFDDEKVSEHTWDTIDLQGGRGDYHMAYLTFWRQRTIKVKKSVLDKAKAEFEERMQKLNDVKAVVIEEGCE